jgi:uncharacterized protein (TIRG00374 family)
MDPMNAQASDGAASVRRWRMPHIPRQVRWTVSAIVLIFVFEYILLPEIASARRSLKHLVEVDIPLLIVAVVLEALALAAYAELSHTVFSPGAPSRFRLFRINMSSLSVSHVLPAGTAPGSAVSYRFLTEAGVSGSTAAFGLAMQGVGSALVLNVIFWFALVISIPLNGFNPLYGFAALAGVFLLAIFGSVIYLLTKGQDQAALFVHRVARRLPFVNADRLTTLLQNVADRVQILTRDRRLLRAALVWAAANWLFDAASLWVFLWAFGKPMFPIYLLVAYGLANILAVLPITPGGLGIVEGVLIPTLVGFGCPPGVATLGVLSYRFVNFWLPIPIGGASYLSLRIDRLSRQARESHAAALVAAGSTAGATGSTAGALDAGEASAEPEEGQVTPHEGGEASTNGKPDAEGSGAGVSPSEGTGTSTGAQADPGGRGAQGDPSGHPTQEPLSR